MTQHKNIILLTSGVADAFFSNTSRRQLEHANGLDERITDLISKNSEKIFGHIDLLLSGDQRKTVDIYKNIRPQRVINVRLHSNKFLDKLNDVVLKEENGDKLITTGNELDHILRPEDYEIHICGVDVHGIYKSIITELLDKGYKVFLYSDLIKRFRETETIAKSIKNRNFKYCSSASALS